MKTNALVSLLLDEAYGDATAGASGVSVWVVTRLRQLGFSSREILEQYPGMTAVDLQAADDYAAAHPDEIAREIADNEADDLTPPPKGWMVGDPSGTSASSM